MGHWQTVQTRSDAANAASDQVLHCLLTEVSFKKRIKMKSTTKQRLKRKWTGPTDRSGKFHSA